MPMPNAVVATTTSSAPSMKRSCTSSRSCGFIPAWYAQAFGTAAASDSASRRVET